MEYERDFYLYKLNKNSKKYILILYLSEMENQEYFNGRDYTQYSREDVLAQNSVQITKVVIRYSLIPHTVMTRIFEQPWPLLTVLILTNDNFSSKACKELTRAFMGTLLKLDLSMNEIQNEGFGHLAKGIWKNLEQLHLRLNRKSSVLDLSKLARGNWPLLRLLSLDEDFPQLQQATSLVLLQSQRLNSLSIDHLRPSNYNVEKIRESFRQRFSLARIT